MLGVFPARSPRPPAAVSQPPPPAGQSLTDAGRLAAVTALFDLDRAVCDGEALNRLARTAARTLGAPTAALSLIGADRQVAVGAFGVPPGGVPELTPGETLCPVCVEVGRTLAVPDVAADPRFRDLPIPAALGVRGYLGSPVTLDDGWLVGTLCVADIVPRDWTAEDRATVADLAGVAADLIRAGRLAAERTAAEARATDSAARARRSERRFRDIAESAGEYLWELDADGRFSFVTDRAEAVFGRPVPELIGKRPWELFGSPDEGARVREWFAGVRDRRESFRDLLRRGRRPDGTGRWVRISGTPTFDDAGAFTGYRGTGLDVTAEHEAERAAETAAAEAAWAAAAVESARRDRSDLLERFIRQAPVAMVMFDREMRYVAHSARFLELHGLPPGGDYLGRSHYEVNDPFPERWKRVHEECLAGATRSAEGDRIERRDGAVGWLDWVCEPWRHADGEIGGLVISCADVTDRHAALHRLQAAVESADIGTWLWDLRGDTLLADAGLRRLFGLPPEAETLGVTTDRMYEAIDARDHARVAAAVQRAYQTGKFQTEYRVLPEPGVTRWVAARGRITRDEDDNPRTFHGAVVDITDRKRAEEELEAAKLAAEASDRAKSEFLANMSHELRTPLTAILGFADLIAGAAGPVPADRHEGGAARGEISDHARTIRRNGEHLLRLINDVLDLAKVESGTLTVERAPFPVGHLVAELIDLMRPRAEDRGLTLRTELPPGGAGAATGDPTRVRQVLLNLLGNAVKFADAGAVTLAVRRTAGESGADPWLEFAVTDGGCGIPAGQLDRLFEPFEQADASTTRRYGGTGLGLSISRRLAERMGGTLTAVSAPGSGSTFTLRVPAPPVGAPAPDRPPAEPTAEPATADPAGPVGGPPPKPLTGRRVLLAEDTADSRRLVTFLLQKAGAEVVAVEHGRAAVDRLLPPNDGPGEVPVDPAGGFDPASGFDVVLMDMQMPVLDGYGAARELRARGYAGPIVALTAHAMDGDADVCREAGCDGYAAKPIGREALVNCVLGALTAGPAEFAGDLPAALEPAPY